MFFPSCRSSSPSFLLFCLICYHQRKKFFFIALGEVKGRRREARDEEPSVSDGDHAPPPKKKAVGKRQDDDIVVCELSRNRRVSARTWPGNVVVDIREFYMANDGKALPRKKGISLFMDQWIHEEFAGDA